MSESVVRLKSSGIILHIGDAISSYEWISTLYPDLLFRRKKSKLFTQVAYYTERAIYNVGYD